MDTQPLDFWESYTLDELARRHGVPLPSSPNELLGGWPEDELDDDFEQAFREWRDRESRIG
jgi:hypothetical protein